MPWSITKERVLPPLWVIVFGILALFVWLMVELKEIVILLVLGYSIAFLIEPALEFLERHEVRRPIGVVVLLGAAIIALLILGITAIPTLYAEYQQLIERVPEGIRTARENFLPLLDDLKQHLPRSLADKVSADQIIETVSESADDIISKIGSGLFATLLTGYNITLTLINLALLPFIVFYLAVDFPSLHRGALPFFPISMRATVQSIANEINTYVSAFIRGQMMVGVVLFVLYAIGLGSIGVELWFVLAIISGFGNMIPYLGFLVGIILSSMMALVTFGDFSHIVAVWGVYGVVQMLEGMLITPKIVGDKVGLSPLVIILAIVAFGKLFGLIGIFLAVPFAAITRVLGRHFYTWMLQRSSYA